MSMQNGETTGDQYDAFAADYHWLYSDEVLSGEPRFEGCRELLDVAGPQAEILDCACGIGTLVVALARHGYSVQGTDASAGMILEAQRRAQEAGVDVPFTPCRWQDLPRHFASQFDLVFCCGNAIGHCRDEADMICSLRGIRSVLKSSGRLVLDTRNWEKLLAERPRFSVMKQARVREGRRCIVLYVWTISGNWEQSHTAEVVMILEENEQTCPHSYPITYYPFRVGDLIDRLRAAGFADVETDYNGGKEWYSVSARVPMK